MTLKFGDRVYLCVQPGVEQPTPSTCSYAFEICEGSTVAATKKAVAVSEAGNGQTGRDANVQGTAEAVAQPRVQNPIVSRASETNGGALQAMIEADRTVRDSNNRRSVPTVFELASSACGFGAADTEVRCCSLLDALVPGHAPASPAAPAASQQSTPSGRGNAATTPHDSGSGSAKKRKSRELSALEFSKPGVKNAYISPPGTGGGGRPARRPRRAAPAVAASAASAIGGAVATAKPMAKPAASKTKAPAIRIDTVAEQRTCRRAMQVQTPQPSTASSIADATLQPALEEEWGSLCDGEQKAALMLGWTEASWADCEPPPACARKWGSLSQPKRAAASLLGFGPESWGGECGGADEPTTRAVSSAAVIGATAAEEPSPPRGRALPRELAVEAAATVVAAPAVQEYSLARASAIKVQLTGGESNGGPGEGAEPVADVLRLLLQQAELGYVPARTIYNTLAARLQAGTPQSQREAEDLLQRDADQQGEDGAHHARGEAELHAVHETLTLLLGRFDRSKPLCKPCWSAAELPRYQPVLATVPRHPQPLPDRHCCEPTCACRPPQERGQRRRRIRAAAGGARECVDCAEGAGTTGGAAAGAGACQGASVGWESALHTVCRRGDGG
eukprot:SAG11_NODE_1442_length_4901_cov_2.114952_2_plen_621_part_00